METTSGADGSLFGARGGGGLRPLGDAFQPDLLRGTGNYAIPFDVPAGPGGIRPNLGIRYSTGQGNGPFGMGWQLSGILSIVRGTDTGVPQYDDDDPLLLGGDRLIDVGDGRWRPRSDTQFWDIRREGAGWRIRTKDGRAFVLGDTAASRIEDAGRVFAWYCSRETDAAGNEISYTYRRDGGQLYLQTASWGIFGLEFVYGERPDAFTTTRSGFAITTGLRCNRVERLCTRTAPPLVGDFTLDYDEATGSGLSLLRHVRYDGIAADGGRDPQPPLGFGYSGFGLDPRLLTVGSDDELLPIGAADAALVDIDGDGLPDVLQTGATGHRWWRNRGDGTFEGARRMPGAPASLRLGAPGVTFADTSADGSADLIGVGSRVHRVARNLANGEWGEGPQVPRRQATLAVSGASSRFVDLDGDGVTDVLQSGPGGLTIFYGDGDASFDSTEFVPRGAGGAPELGLDDPGVFVADFAGDGMRTLGEIRSGLVRYWPHLGRGRFGPIVEMADPPVFPRLYRERNLFLTDVDGDGTTDLLYVDGDRLLVWLNRCGRAWSAPIEVPFAPPPDVATLELIDLLGTGTPGLLWRRRGTSAPRYLDLAVGDGAGKPYLLDRVDNGCGLSTEIFYAGTTTLRNGHAGGGGDRWGTYLPFPLQVVRTLLDRDAITGAIARTDFDYERGCFDPLDRVFRGFEAVEVTRVGEPGMPTTVRRTSFHLGDTGGPATAVQRDETARTRLHALAGATVGVDLFVLDDSGARHPMNRTRIEWAARDEFTDAGGARVCFPHLVSATSTDIADGGRDRVEETSYAYDRFGNVVSKRRALRFDGDAESRSTIQEITYVADEASWLVGLPTRITTRDGDGALLGEESVRYDGPAFQGLAEGEVTRGLMTRRIEMMLVGDRLPAGYAVRIGADWGLTRIGENWFRTIESVQRDAAGNVVAQADPTGGRTTIEYDADRVFPVRSVDPLGRATTARFDPRTVQPLEVTTPDGVRTRYEYSASGRLVAQFDTTADGTEALTGFSASHAYDPSTPQQPAHTVSVRPRTAGRTVAELAQADPAAIADAAVEIVYVDGRGQTVQRSAPAGNDRGEWVIGGRARRTPDGAALEEFPNDLAAAPGYRAELPQGASVRYTYDGLGRGVLIDHPDGGRLRVAYLGDRMLRWDAETADDEAPVVEHYDVLGALVAVDTPL
ncbi:SpvB/TcaC N-terminal domain-containing protein, partial [Microbacterium sp.]|uniref:SpvB/TcaC N-terminal domain-containing protein n=1 Tax=Microbacterium sp. TaxID=51671 RepID=UPI002E30FE9C